MKNKFINKNPLLMGSKRSIGNKMLFSNNNKKSRNSNSSKNSLISLRIKPIVNNVRKQKTHIKQKIYKPFSNTFKVKTNYKVPTKYKISTKYKASGLRKMNWPQLKQRLPGLRPNSDADFDGLINSRDCKPLDPSKDGVFGRVLSVLTGGRAGQSKEEYKAEKAEKRERKDEAKAASVSVKQERREAREAISQQVERIAAQRKSAMQLISEVSAKEEIEKKREKISERIAAKQAEEKAEGRAKLKKHAKQFGTIFLRNVVGRVPRTSKERKAIKARRKSGFVKVMAKAVGATSSSQTKKAKKTATGQKGIGAGRPTQSYKYTDPRTGQPIPAVTYWKIRKQLKERAKDIETQAEVQQRFELAKRGLSPEEIAAQQTEINQKMARLRALKAIKNGEIPEGYGVTEEGEIVEIPAEEQQQQQDDQQVMYEEGVEPSQEPQQYEQQIEQQYEPQYEQQVYNDGQDLSTEQLEYERQLQLQQLMQQQGMQQQVQQYQQQPTQQYPQVQQQQRARPAFNVPGASQVPPGYKLNEDLMTGRKWLEQLPPQEAWTR